MDVVLILVNFNMSSKDVIVNFILLENQPAQVAALVLLSFACP